MPPPSNLVVSTNSGWTNSDQGERILVILRRGTLMVRLVSVRTLNSSAMEQVVHVSGSGRTRKLIDDSDQISNQMDRRITGLGSHAASILI